MIARPSLLFAFSIIHTRLIARFVGGQGVKMAEEKKIGKVTHFFGKISVAIVKLSTELKIGSKVHFKGNTTDFEQKVDSMQINHDSIEKAKAKNEVGIKVKDPVREDDEVFQIVE